MRGAPAAGRPGRRGDTAEREAVEVALRELVAEADGDKLAAALADGIVGETLRVKETEEEALGFTLADGNEEKDTLLVGEMEGEALSATLVGATLRVGVGLAVQLADGRILREDVGRPLGVDAVLGVGA